MGPLADPAAHGGDPADAFHVVVPSLPGFGFSGPTREAGYDTSRIARAFDTLMQRLGYDRYFAQGGDKGTLVSILLAANYPERVAAIHLNLMPAIPPDGPDPTAGLEAEELRFLEANAAFAQTGAGYQLVQRTRPQTLAFGLMDSPAGLAAWLADKFQAWSDCDGDVDRAFSRDRLLDNISLYWLTGAIASSVRLYFEDHGPGRQQPLPAVTVPVGHAQFPAEIVKAPRAWVERQFNIVHWRKMPAGGHFAAMEQPDLFVEEVRGFFRRLR
jgi:microsomal epoxide hydrolase